MKKIVCTLLAVLILQQAATAQPELQLLPPPAGEEFEARLLLTSDSKQFLEGYAADKPVEVADGSMTRFARSFRVMCQISGCTLDAKGLCNVTAAVTVFNPRGSLHARYGEGPGNFDLDILVNELPPAKSRWKIIEVGRQPAFMEPELARPGDYLILATFTDHNRGKGTAEAVTAWKVIHVTE